MKLDKILKTIQKHKEFSDFTVVKNVLSKNCDRDLLVGFSFEKTMGNLYIWLHIQPLIFDIDYQSYLFSKRLNIPGSIAFEEFNVDNALPILIKEVDVLPNSLNDLINICNQDNNLSFEQIEELYWVRIYLNANNNVIDTSIDDVLIKHLSSIDLKYDYQKERLERAKFVVNLSLSERKDFFDEIVTRKSLEWKKV